MFIALLLFLNRSYFAPHYYQLSSPLFIYLFICVQTFEDCDPNILSVLRNNTHVILALCDWLRLVSSSTTGQWGGGVVFAPLLRCYKTAAMRDERRNSDPKRHHTCEFAKLPCLFVVEGHLDLQRQIELKTERLYCP